jgi:hypothetical protein
MDTNTLIEQLARDATPVRRLPPPRRRFLRWLLFSTLYIVAVAVFLGVRPATCAHATGLLFWTATALIAAVGALGGLLAFQLSVPGHPESRGLRWIVPALVAAWGGLLLASAAATPDCTAGPGLACSLELMAVGLVPALLLFALLHRAAPLAWARSGLLAGFVLAAAGGLALQFLCSNQDPLHLFAWHFLPTLLLAALGLLAAARLLRNRT